MRQGTRRREFWILCISLEQVKQWRGVTVFLLISVLAATLIVSCPPPDEVQDVDAVGVCNADQQPVYRGNPHVPLMSLTINVDWGQEVLPEMLEVLQEKETKVTFFVTGRWAKQYPEMVKRFAADGHEVGNHGMKHAHPRSLSDWDLAQLIVENEKLLQEIIGECPRLFAPPYGEVDERVAVTAAQLGYRTIMWTIDTIDWQNPSVETTVRRVLDRAQNGGIVLMHPKPNTVRALPRIIDGLRRQGYALVTVTELLESMEDAESSLSRQHRGP